MEIDGAGNSFEVLDYSFEDEDISWNGIYFYRLKQVDFNGNFSFSEVIAISVDRPTTIDYTVFPNPTTDYLNVELDISGDKDLNIHMFDIDGKLVKTRIASDQESGGTRLLKLDVSNLIPGRYLLRFEIESRVFIEKIIIAD